MALLELEALTVEFNLEDGGRLRAVDGLNLSINTGEAVGLVGESGSGKSVTALSIMRLLDPAAEIAGGSIWFQGEDLVQRSEAAMSSVRGHKIGMVFQEPMTSLNPSFTAGEHVAEAFRRHLRMDRAEARQNAIQMFERVKMPRAAEMYSKYPHELSGGMRQRVMIAAALACGPTFLIADEPTTALDVTIQGQIISLLEELQKDMGLALLFISHDLGVVAHLCHKVAVMYGARLVEVADTDALFDLPHHPYTQGLIQSIPVRGRPLRAIPDTIFDLRAPPPGCRFHPRCAYAQAKCSEIDPRLEAGPNPGEETHLYACHFPLKKDSAPVTVGCEESNGQEQDPLAVTCSAPMIQPFLRVRGLKRYFDISGGTVSRLLNGKRILKAVDDVSFEVGHGQTLALVGESGSGKSTTARLIARLLPAMGGEIVLNDRNLLNIPLSEMRTIRKRIQFVFQDPFSSLNPRMEVEETIGRSLTLHFGLTGQDRRRRVRELLEQVGLARQHLHRYPHQFSGGQRQRIAVARALASEPDLILADEPVSSLDVSIQAQVLELLQDLRKRLNLTMVFITHDLNVAEFVSDRVAVMYGGKIMEQGPVETVLRRPLHPYTKALLEGRPRVERRKEPLRFPEGEPSVPINAAPGCRFANRCPIRVAACTEADIPLVRKGIDHQVACIRV